MAVTIQRVGITEISCTCGDLFEVQPDGSIFKLAEEGESCEWLVGAKLADYIVDPECSNCFETLTFHTSSEEIAR